MGFSADESLLSTLSLSCIVSLAIFMIHYEQDAYCSHTPVPLWVEKQTSTDHITNSVTVVILTGLDKRRFYPDGSLTVIKLDQTKTSENRKVSEVMKYHILLYLFNFWQSLFTIVFSDGSRISQRGRQPQKGAYYLTYFFAENYTKMKKMDWGGHTCLAPPDPPLI